MLTFTGTGFSICLLQNIFLLWVTAKCSGSSDSQNTPTARIWSPVHPLELGAPSTSLLACAPVPPRILPHLHSDGLSKLLLAGTCSPAGMMQEKICASGHNVFLFNIGQESAVADRSIISGIWRNRRLMASPNGTHEEKNCTEPGKMRRLCNVL